MTLAISEFLGFFILIPGIIGLIRFRKINPIFRPFLYCIWTGTVNELLSYFIIRSGHSNAVNANIYMLVEALLYTWQFRKWNLFNKTTTQVLYAFLLLSWIFEVMVFFRITVFSSYFLVTYSFVLSLLSVAMINRLLVHEKRALLKHPVFIICTAFLLYYTFSVLSEVFWVYGLDENKQFRIHVITISIITNFIANLLFSIATLWIPTNQRFTLPS